MSQIKEIATPNLKNLESLLKALEEAGVPKEAIEVDRTLSNSLPLVQFGYARTQKNALSVRIRRDVTGGYEDAGFRYQDGRFVAVVSTHDRNNSGALDFGEQMLQKTTVRYTINETKRLARRKGYILTEKLEGNTLRLICKKLS